MRPGDIQFWHAMMESRELHSILFQTGGPQLISNLGRIHPPLVEYPLVSFLVSAPPPPDLRSVPRADEIPFIYHDGA